MSFSRLALALGAATLLAAPPLAMPSLAQSSGGKVNAEVVERGTNGHATKVRIDGKVYAVCTSDQQDSCINPRAAGLNFGNVPLDHWPGMPASEMHKS